MRARSAAEVKTTAATLVNRDFAEVGQTGEDGESGHFASVDFTSATWLWRSSDAGDVTACMKDSAKMAAVFLTSRSCADGRFSQLERQWVINQVAQVAHDTPHRSRLLEWVRTLSH